MKKLLLTSLVAIVALSVNAQSAIKEAKVPLLSLAPKATANTAAKATSVVCGVDTSSYIENACGPSFSGYYFTSTFAQFFPTGINTVMGVKAYLNPLKAGSIPCTAKIFAAMPDSTIGAELASAPFTISKKTLTSLEDARYIANFTSPVWTNGAYYLAIVPTAGLTDTAVIYGSPSGKAEPYYPCLINDSADVWQDASAFIDMLIEPLYNYDLNANFTTAIDPNDPKNVHFIATAINAVDEPAYNVNAGFNTGVPAYAWDFGDGLTGDGRNVDHQYSANGTYNAKLTTNFFFWSAAYHTSTLPCKDSVTKAITVPLAAGINDAAAKAFSVYPNPTNGDISISSANVINTVTLTNLVGVQVSVAAVNNNNYKANLANIAKGVYFLTVKFSNGNVTTQKLTINE